MLLIVIVFLVKIFSQELQSGNESDYKLLEDKYLPLDLVKIGGEYLTLESIEWSFHCRISRGMNYGSKERLIVIYKKFNDSLFYKYLFPSDSALSDYIQPNISTSNLDIPMKVYNGYVNSDTNFYKLVNDISNYEIPLIYDTPGLVLDAGNYECRIQNNGEKIYFELNSYKREKKKILLWIEKVEERILQLVKNKEACK